MRCEVRSSAGTWALAFLSALGLLIGSPSASGAAETVCKSDSLSAAIDSLRAHARYAAAVGVAKDLLACVQANPATRPYQVVNAERLVRLMEGVSAFPESLQAELAWADGSYAKVIALWTDGSLADGTSIAERQLEIRERVLGAGSELVAASLDVLALLHADQGRSAQAESLGQRALAIREKELGPDHPDVASSLDNQATYCLDQGRYAEAEPLLQRALSIQEKALGPDHSDLAESLKNLAGVYWNQGRYPQAESLLRCSLPIQEKAYGPDHPLVGTCLSKLAMVCLDQGRYFQAEPLGLRALAITEKSFGPSHPEVAQCLSILAKLYLAQGRYAQAEPLCKRALAIREAALGPDHAEVGSNLNQLAFLNKSQGRYAQAESLYQRALAIHEEALGTDHPLVAGDLNGLALLCVDQGRYSQAEPLYQRELAIMEKARGPDHPHVATALNNLAGLYQDMGRCSQAESLYQRALAVNEKALGQDHPDLAANLAGLASLYQDQRRYAQAVPLYRRALAIRKEAFGPDHPGVGRILRDLAEVRYADGDATAAESLLVEASTVWETARLRVGRGLERATFQASPYPLLAEVQLAEGHTQEAWPAAERELGRALFDLLSASRQRSLTATESAREDSLQRLLGDQEQRLKAYLKEARQDTTGEATNRVEGTHKRLLAMDAEWSAMENSLAAKYPVTEGQTYPLERVQAVLVETQAIIGWLDVELRHGTWDSWGYVIRHRGPVQWAHLDTTATGTDGSSPLRRVARVRNLLSSGEEWTATKRQIGRDLWSVRMRPLESFLAEVTDLTVIPSGAMVGLPLEALPDDHDRWLCDRYSISYAPSATIYTWLRERSRDERAGARPSGATPAGATAAVQRAWTDSTTFLLVGDPPFNQAQAREMQEEQSPTLAQGQNLAGDSANGEAPTWTLASLPTSPPDTLLLRSAVSGDSAALDRIPRLPWTRREVTSLAELTHGATTLLGSDASEQALVELACSGELKRFRGIHLATHAWVNPQRPEQSCLLLSRVDLPDPLEAAEKGGRIYDGLLTVKEILQEWDLDADLVTLSGCETALGQTVASEGFIGFVHSFLQAGARSVVVSLWPVADEATALLMKRFYANLFASEGSAGVLGAEPQKSVMTKREALRKAKAWLREYQDEDGRRPYAGPFYWAAFVLLGDPD